jgi:hypothetical protein
MHKNRLVAAMSAGLLLPLLALGKDKPKSTVPTYVLQARTVAVIVDPSAGLSMRDPQANQVAQRDVETALLNWGRFQPILSTQHADLIVVIRRGTGKAVDGTIHDPREGGNRPAVIEPTDTGISVGGQRGHEAPPLGTPPNQGGLPGGAQNQPIGGPIDQRPYPQIEGGSATTEDSFVVYLGSGDDPLDSPPAWRYMAKNCLKPHTVPAVDAFRKAVDDAEQAAAKQP